MVRVEKCAFKPVILSSLSCLFSFLQAILAQYIFLLIPKLHYELTVRSFLTYLIHNYMATVYCGNHKYDNLLSLVTDHLIFLF